MPMYAFSIEVEAEPGPLEVPVHCQDGATAARRAGELLVKFPPFERISVWTEGELVCRVDREAIAAP
jgi:hypothetical protein